MLVSTLLLAQDRVAPRGIGGDGEPFGAVELLVLAVFIGVVVGLVVRASRLRTGPRDRRR